MHADFTEHSKKGKWEGTYETYKDDQQPGIKDGY